MDEKDVMGGVKNSVGKLEVLISDCLPDLY
jgi:hypothetical protein